MALKEKIDKRKNYTGHYCDIPEDKQILYTVLWYMVMERVLKLTFDESMTYKSITSFKLTEYGENFLQGLPIDRPDQYLDYLELEVPNIDTRILVYIQESLDCYNLGCYFASCVMLGVGAERLFELLIDAYTKFIPNRNEQTQFKQKTEGKSISIQYNEFKNKLSDLTGRMGSKQQIQHQPDTCEKILSML